MELYIAIGAVALVAVLLVGLFHGPSHRDTRRSAAAPTPPAAAGAESPTVAGASSGPADDAATGAATPAPLPLPVDPPAYVMPPARKRHLPQRHATGPRGRRP